MISASQGFLLLRIAAGTEPAAFLSILDTTKRGGMTKRDAV